MNDQKCREAFEKWVSDSGRPHLLNRWHGAWYEDLTVSGWWTAWSAAWNRTQPKHEPVGELPAKLLTDVQWMNIVNHDRVWQNHTKEDAVHEAVKMTEAKCIANAQTFANTRAREALERYLAWNLKDGWKLSGSECDDKIRELIKEYE